MLFNEKVLFSLTLPQVENRKSNLLCQVSICTPFHIYTACAQSSPSYTLCAQHIHSYTTVLSVVLHMPPVPSVFIPILPVLRVIISGQPCNSRGTSMVHSYESVSSLLCPNSNHWGGRIEQIHGKQKTNVVCCYALTHDFPIYFVGTLIFIMHSERGC